MEYGFEHLYSGDITLIRTNLFFRRCNRMTQSTHTSSSSRTYQFELSTTSPQVVNTNQGLVTSPYIGTRADSVHMFHFNSPEFPYHLQVFQNRGSGVFYSLRTWGELSIWLVMILLAYVLLDSA